MPAETPRRSLPGFLARLLGHLPLQQRISALEDECADLKRRYSLLTDNLAAAVIVRDAQNKVQWCSPYTEVLTGYALSEIFSATDDFFARTVHPDDREAYERAHKVAQAGEAFQFRYRYYHKSGIEMWAETRTVPVFGEDEESFFSLSISLDVTGTVRYQRQIEEKNRDLHDFTYMVSHDLKAPVFTIKGMLNWIKEDFADSMPGELADAFGHIDRASGRLEEMVKSLLEYARISTQDFVSEPVSLDRLLEGIARDFATQLESSGGRLVIAPGLPQVIGDELRVYQIFSNLIGNAIKYRDPARELLIEVAPQSAAAGHFVTLEVRDNGLGIPEANLNDIFRPFYRIKGRKAEGTGIGLACVKKLLEKLGGEVSVQSTEGQGSCFRISLRG